MFCGAVESIVVCVVQLFVSLAVRAFAPPVAFGLAGDILGLLCTAKGWGYLFPYALLCLGMRTNNPTMELDLAPFLLSVLCFLRSSQSGWCKSGTQRRNESAAAANYAAAA